MTRTFSIFGVAALACATGCTNFVGVADMDAEEGAPVATDDDGGQATSYETPTVSRPFNCAYPQGSYGVTEGQIVPALTSWTGYPAGEAAPRDFDLSELYDCEGTKGVHAILVDTSQYG